MLQLKCWKAVQRNKKKALAEKVTAAVVETTGAPAEKVVIFIDEMTKNNYAIAGKRLSDE